eukprot:gene15814-17409_t
MHERAVKKLAKAFEKVDVNSDHTIDWEELQSCCENLNIKVDDKDYQDFCQCDSSQDGRLNFEEFCTFVESRLHKVFNGIDTDGSGTLDAFEIQKCLEKLSSPISIRKIMSIIAGMDKDGDGVINFEEFCDFFADMPTADLKAVADKWARGFALDLGSDQVPSSLPPSEVPVWRFMFAGGCGGVVSRTVTAPLEKIKILAQTSAKQGRMQITKTLASVWKKEGMQGLFAGNLTNVLRIFPTSAMVCLVYSRMIKYTPVDNEKNPNQPLWRLFSGATAGAVANAFTHPMDVVRARLTIQDISSKDAIKYKGISHAVRTIVKEEGFAALYKGLSPTLISIAPFLAIQQCLYDVAKNFATSSVLIGNNVSTFLVCGALAGTIAQTAVHPLDVVRRTMQVDKKIVTTKQRLGASYTIMTSLLRQGGVPRLYAGLTAAYLKVVPSAAVSLLVRDALLGRLEG